MATDAIFVLERLRCFRESDGTGHSEPYIWPVLVVVDDHSLALPEQVRVIAPSPAAARVVVKDDMRAGHVADIPSHVGTIRTRVDDDLDVLRMILVVAVLEEDETPSAAVKAGFNAFTAAIGVAIGSRLQELNNASPEEMQVLLKVITAEVQGKVETATHNALSASQKVRVFLGTLNLDDVIGTAFRSFNAAEAQSFVLVQTSGAPSFSNVYAIDARLDVMPVRVDLCQTSVNQLRDAQATVDLLLGEIRALQAQLQGHGGAGDVTLSKTAILRAIRRLRDEELPPAEAALEAARAALNACRTRSALFIDPTASFLRD